MNKKNIFILFFLLFAFLFTPILTHAEDQSIDELNRKIDEYITKLNELGKSKNTLANQIKIIDSKVQLTILQISQTEASIKLLEKEISNLTVKIDQLDKYLDQLSSVYIKEVNQNYKLEKRVPPFAYLLTKKFNEYLQQQKYITALQKNSQTNLINMETTRTNFDIQKAEKTKKQDELEVLKKKLSTQQSDLNKQKSAKNNLLESTKNDEKKYQQLLTEAQNQLRSLKAFSSSAGGSSCLSSFPGVGSDGFFFSQRDPAWCQRFIGNSQDTIGEVGCYISSISMVFNKIANNNKNISPLIYASDPSKFSLNTAYAKNPIPPSGYIYKQTSYSSSIVDEELKNGRYVIVQIKMTGTVSGMHFVVIISGSGGNYKIHDPWYGADQNFSDHYSLSSIMSLRLITK
jgi:peptidoglycan hydrolase CwlO-like protein